MSLMLDPAAYEIDSSPVPDDDDDEDDDDVSSPGVSQSDIGPPAAATSHTTLAQDASDSSHAGKRLRLEEDS